MSGNTDEGLGVMLEVDGRGALGGLGGQATPDPNSTSQYP